MTNSRPQVKKIRDPIESLKTRYWYHGLCIRLNVRSGYALEKLVQPAGSHPSKWSRYRSGTHTPKALTLRRADNVVWDSSRDVTHILWDSLQEHLNLEDVVPLLRKVSSDEIRAILLAQGFLKKRLDDRDLRMLQHRAGLDSLACLTIMIRLKHATAKHKEAWELAPWLFRMLLILGTHFVQRGIADDLFRLYCERVLGMLRWEGKRFLVEEFDYVLLSSVLHEAAEDAGIKEHETIRRKREILELRFGIKFMFFFRPLIGPDLAIGPPTEASVRELEKAKGDRYWQIRTDPKSK